MAEELLARPRAVVFDWDGTLVDSWRAIHGAIEASFPKMGHEPWTLEETKRRVRHSMRNAFPQLFGERWQEAARLFYEAYARLHVEATHALPGAEDLLRTLDEAGVYLAVLSNKNGHYMRLEAATLGWERYFVRLVGATDALEDKPSAVAFRLALEQSGVEPGSAVWMVGDAAIDLECARNAGSIGVLVGPGADVAESGLRPALRVADCAALTHYFARL